MKKEENKGRGWKGLFFLVFFGMRGERGRGISHTGTAQEMTARTRTFDTLHVAKILLEVATPLHTHIIPRSLHT